MIQEPLAREENLNTGSSQAGSAFILPAFILCILSIHVKRSFSSVFLCSLCGESFSLFSAPLRLCARIMFFSVSLGDMEV